MVQGGDTKEHFNGEDEKAHATRKLPLPLRWCSQDDGLTGLSGLPPCLLDVLLSLVAQLDLQLLGLHLQVFLALCEGFAGLEWGTAQHREAVQKAAARLQGLATYLPNPIFSAYMEVAMLVFPGTEE